MLHRVTSEREIPLTGNVQNRQLRRQNTDSEKPQAGGRGAGTDCKQAGRSLLGQWGNVLQFVMMAAQYCECIKNPVTSALAKTVTFI